jgi:hypothetical protein
MRNRYLDSTKVYLCKNYILVMNKKSNIKVEKPGRDNFEQVIKEAIVYNAGKLKSRATRQQTVEHISTSCDTHVMST